MDEDTKIITYILDSYHDFLNGERVSMKKTRWKYDIVNYIPGIVYERGFSQRVIDELTKNYEHSEKGVENLLKWKPVPIKGITIPNSEADSLALLTQIFNELGLKVSKDQRDPVIRLVCDMGVRGLGRIAENIDGYINIVNVVTPATACDSARLSRDDSFNKPILFKDGNGVDGTPLYSKASILSMSKIYETSDVITKNVEPNSDLHIDGKIINIKSGGGPGVNDLLSHIMNVPEGSYDLRTFSVAQLLDIKRCGDSDQIEHMNSLQKREPGAKYVFVTGDKICACIAAMIYRLPTIFNSYSGKKCNFEIWNPNRPVNGGVDEDEEMEEYDEEVIEYTEEDFVKSITSLCADQLRSLISKENPELAALCSYHVIEQYASGKFPMSTEILQEYIKNHNAIYAKLGWSIDSWPPGPHIAVKLRHIPAFNYKIFESEPYSTKLKESAIYVANSLAEEYQDINTFVSDKPYAKNSYELLRYPVIGILTLALTGDFIQTPNDPGSSVISTFVFNRFLPGKLPNIRAWSESDRMKYGQYLTVISNALFRKDINREVTGLIGGRRRKSFRYKHNGRTIRKIAVRRDGSNPRTYRKIRTSNRTGT